MRRKRAVADDTIMGAAGSGLVVLTSADLRRPRSQRGGASVREGESACGQLLTVGTWGPAKRQSLVDSIVAEIEGRIASGDLKDGDTLPCQRDLALALGVSRTPLREALNRLTGMGLVELRQGSGTFIRVDGMSNLAQ